MIKLAHVAFNVKDIEKSLDFYCNCMGLEEHFRLYNSDESLYIVYLRDKFGQYIELFPDSDPLPYDKDQSFQHVIFLSDDLEKTAAELEEKKIPLYLGPIWLNMVSPVPFKSDFIGKAGSRSFFLKDPDGNEIEVMAYTEKSLHAMTKEQIDELEPLIRSNTYIRSSF